jgi:DNA helicase-4
LKPEALNKAATRWPHLQLDFMTIHASKGQQADYVIVVGLQEGRMRFLPRRASRLWSRRSCRSRKIFLMRKSGVCCTWRSPARVIGVVVI